VKTCRSLQLPVLAIENSSVWYIVCSISYTAYSLYGAQSFILSIILVLQAEKCVVCLQIQNSLVGISVARASQHSLSGLWFRNVRSVNVFVTVLEAAV